jgi:DNA modification methylase
MNLLKKANIRPFTEKDDHSWNKYKFDKLDKLDEIKLQEKLEGLEKKQIQFQKGKIPTDVWQKNNHTASKEYAGWHPTQKPIVLLERIIRANTNKGDVVLDCFSGSGSTMIASAKCARSFVGSEFDTEYYHKSLQHFKNLTEV